MNWYKRQLKIAAPPRDWSNEELEKIKKLLEEGRSTREIGKMFGTNHSSIRALNNKYKWVNLKDKGNALKNIFLEKAAPYIDQVVELHNRGLGQTEISKALRGELTNNQVRNILISKGLITLRNKDEREEVIRKRKEKDERISYMYLPPPEGLGMSSIQIGEYFQQLPAVIIKSLKRSGIKARSTPESAELSGGKDRQRELMKRWHEDPSNKDMIREIAKKRYEDPQYRKNISEKMTLWWKQFEGEDGEKLKNRLLSYPTRQKAINHLSGFVGKKAGEDSNIANAIYNRYIQVINNHTFPDEVQQPQPV